MINKSAVLFTIIFTLLTACEPVSQSSIEHQEPQSAQASRTLLTRGVYGDLTLDVYQLERQEQAQFLRDLFEGLVGLDPTGQVIPALAESWHTEDYQQWRFTLREGLSWSNGTPLVAQDFVQSWQQLARSETALKQYLALMNINNAQAVIAGHLPVQQLGVVAIDERILQLTLDKPTPYLVKMLSNVALFPHYQGQLKEGEFVSNGAYQLLSQQDNVIHLGKNPYYWNEKAVAFKQVDYHKINATQDITTLDLVEEPRQPVANLQYFDRLCTYYYEFNFRHPLLAQQRIRNGLTSLLALTHIEGLPATLRVHRDFLPQNLQQQFMDHWQGNSVEQLLSQQGISERNPLTLRLTYDTESIHPLIAEQLIRMWSQSDMIRIKPEPVTWQQLQQKRNQGDFDLIRSGWCADYNDPMAFFSLLYSHSPDNKMGYQNAQFDKFLEQALLAQQENVKALYVQLENLVQEDKVVLPLFQYRYPVYFSPSIAGYQQDNPTGVIYSKDLFRRVISRSTLK
ncbi:peptide ABC transporter substrate-binding protein [Volucribacter amazonae]|nr:peptide ABC transporter substrate-binding protein [Volucribacter amazonae]